MKIKHWKLWTIAILLLLLVLFILTYPSGPVITISKETTYITKPLKPDGTVDYLAALNQRLSEGVTPENNAAVLFWQAAGPKEILPEYRDEYFQKVGIPRLPDVGDYFGVLSDDYVKRLTEAGSPTAEQTKEKSALFWKQWEEVAARPWSKEEFPDVAEWIAVTERPMQLVVQGCARPRYYHPLVAGEDALLMGALLMHGQSYRAFSRFFLRRSMLRLGEGKVDEAWADLLACHRLARLAAQGPWLINALVGFTIEGIACDGDQTFLLHAQLTADQLVKIRANLDQLPPLADTFEKVGFLERCAYLDAMSTVARHGSFTDLLSTPGASSAKLTGSKIVSTLGSVVTRKLNWNLILRDGNSWYDRFADALRKPSRTERMKATQKIEDDLHDLAKGITDWKRFALSMIGSPRRALSQQVGNMCLSLFLPAVSSVFHSEEQCEMQFEIVKLGFALAAYRVDNGAYPEKLADLIPKYVTEVPKDIFNDADLHYQRDGDGYLLYSVGPNGKDDGGKTFEDSQKSDGLVKWDDIAIRIPAVGSTITEQANESKTAEGDDAPKE